MPYLIICFSLLVLLVAGLEIIIRRRAQASSGAWATRPLPAFDAAATRLVVLGDSIAYGTDLLESEAWPAVLQHRLSHSYPARRWQVINAGVSGNTVADAYARYDEHVRAYKPHIVFMALGLNDCRQVYRSHDARRAEQFRRNETTLWGRSYLLKALMMRLRPLPPVDEISLGVQGPRVPSDTYGTILNWLIDQSEKIGALPVTFTLTPISPDLDVEALDEFALCKEYSAIVRQSARTNDITFVEVSHRFPTDKAWLDDGVHLSVRGEAIIADRVWQALHRPDLRIYLGLEIPLSNAEMAPSLE